jgi:hypothetical protein
MLQNFLTWVGFFYSPENLFLSISFPFDVRGFQRKFTQSLLPWNFLPWCQCGACIVGTYLLLIIFMINN